MKNERRTVVGILAHVDAGKTTLAEAMLYQTGKLKKLGRVDHRDSFLDNQRLERERGITIFSKQALLPLGNTDVTLLDTPGHVDFSAEMERTLRVLDCAVLVVSGTDGVQAHTETLWRLLRHYAVPTLLFVTKMDLPGPGRDALAEELRRRLSDACLDFSDGREALGESLALCSEEAMEEYLEAGAVSEESVRRMFRSRQLFPLLFGSGLRLEGVDALLQLLDSLAPPSPDRGGFAAQVFKIGHEGGARLTYMKITGGELRVRDLLRYRSERGEPCEEKAAQLRLYSGGRFEAVDAVGPGQIVAVPGLTATWPGQGLGAESDAESPQMEPVLSYRVIPPAGMDAMLLFPMLRQLGEEEPALHLGWDKRNRQIELRLMGRVQTEVFCSLVRERFDLDVTLDKGHILYRETIADTVEGVGHYEPLRHYAEVHLILSPGERGSGIVLDSSCSEDALDRNWQRLILTHLMERQHLGVLTGSPLTDVKITLAAGRAHLKHTEGGDFRQATYRAVRQGLMQAKSVLLEPVCRFSLEVPAAEIGRAISDVRQISGSFEAPEDAGEFMRLEGTAPVSEMNGYMETLLAYTRGRGRLSMRPAGYLPCHNSEAVIAEAAYDPESDPEHSPDSVFCAHGAGFVVKWKQVPDYMHLESVLRKPEEPVSAPAPLRRSLSIDERELEAIMEREFGPIRRAQYSAPRRNEAPKPAAPRKKEYLIVDGYNLIFAWEELKKLAADHMDLARTRLMDLLSNYCGFTRTELVLVFDGYRNPGSRGSRSEYHNIHIAYTGDGETGDAYIERIVDEIGKNYDVRVVTSDNLIRLSALRSGVLRTSSGEFVKEVEWVLAQIEDVLNKTNLQAHMTKLKDGKQ